MIKKLLNKPEGLKLKFDYAEPSLDIVQIDKVTSLVFSLSDAKMNQYIPTVKPKQHVKAGQIIAMAENGSKILASLDGQVSNISNTIAITPSNENYFYQDLFYNDNFILSDFSSQQILEKIEQANIQGLGGALFSTAIKLKSNKIKILTLNAVECEPIMNCDEALLTHHLAEVLTGGLLLQKASGAKQLDIAVKQSKTTLINHIKYFIKNNQRFNKINLKTVPDQYPSGAERIIIKRLYGKTLNYKDIPTEHGFLVNNVATAFSVFRACFGNFAQNERIISVFGENLVNAYNVLAPIGTSLADIFKFLNLSPNDISAIRFGGLMMGKNLDSNINLNQTGVLKSTNGLILNIKQKNNIESPCINCNKCGDVCPVKLIPNKMYKHAKQQDFSSSYLKNLNNCLECNLCNIVCPSNIELTEMFKQTKTTIQTEKLEKERAIYIAELTQKKQKRLEAETLAKQEAKRLRKLRREIKNANKSK